MRFSQLHFTRMFAGARGLPAHVFPDCPHVQRMRGSTGVAATYRLGAESRTLKLIRCKWCRSRYLTWWAEDTEIPAELAQLLAMVPREVPPLQEEE